MKIILSVIFILISLAPESEPQEYDYWKNAPIQGNKIFSICFTLHQIGYAVSNRNEVFESLDSGYTWVYKTADYRNDKTVPKDTLWSADIYCSVMQSTDGGLNWSAYTKEEQEHFCRVYFKNDNTGFQTADEFLNKVTSVISNYISNKNISSLVDYPQQCTEYYSSENEGWALGWCLRNFKKRN